MRLTAGIRLHRYKDLPDLLGVPMLFSGGTVSAANGKPLTWPACGSYCFFQSHVQRSTWAGHTSTLQHVREF